MKVVMVSDTHGFHADPFFDDMPDGDLLVHAGDLTLHGSTLELQDVNKWFGTLKNKYADIICIGGNHDIALAAGGKVFAEKVLTNATYLYNTHTEIWDKVVYGSPDTHYPHGFTDEMIEQNKDTRYVFGHKDGERDWSDISDATDIVLTHSPPFGKMDLIENWYTNKFEHLGDKNLRDIIEAYKPKLHVFGHIHEGADIEKNKDTVFVNASCCDEHYNLVNKPRVVEI